MSRVHDQDGGEDGWKRSRDRKALERAAQRMRWRERERRVDEWGGEADREPVPRVD